MPISFGGVFLFCLFAGILYLLFRDKRRSKESLRVSEVSKREEPIATVVESGAAGVVGPVASPPTPAVEPKRERTGKAANVVGIGTLFRCEEYQCGETLETDVFRIDEKGRALSPSSVYREPFQGIIESFVNIAA